MMNFFKDANMKLLRFFITIGVLMLTIPVLHAQDFLQKAKNYLNAGECEKAQRAYNAYKVENPGGNAEVERRITECENNLQQKRKTSIEDAEKEAFNRCIDVLGCEAYLKNYPNGKYVAVVQNKKQKLLEEDNDYKNCVFYDNSISRCEDFIRKYPNSIYVDAVNKKKQLLQTEDNVYKNCKSVSQCYDYLQQYPQGRYVKEVEALRDSLGSCGTIKDYDGNRYRTVQVGSQCWMAENLRNTTYADGSYISFNERGIFIGAGRGYCYLKDSSTKDKYGLLYTWAAALDVREEEIEKQQKKQRKTTNTSSNSVFPSKVQGLCPKGWHVPSIADWEQLKEQLNNGNPSQKYTERLNMNPYDGWAFWTSERETGEFFYGTGMKYFKNGSMVFSNTYFASANLFVRCVKD